MKPEIGYPDMVMASYIDDLLKDIEWNIRCTSLKDPYFQQLSVEKFALETLLEEIAECSGIITAEKVIERFAQQAERRVTDSHDPNNSYVFEVSRDAAMSILDGFYFGFLEGEEHAGL